MSKKETKEVCFVCGKKWKWFLNYYGPDELVGYICQPHYNMIALDSKGNKKNKSNYTKILNFIKRKELELMLEGKSKKEIREMKIEKRMSVIHGTGKE